MKIPAKDTAITINSVSLEDDIDTWNLGVTPEAIIVTSLSDTGPRR